MLGFAGVYAPRLAKYATVGGVTYLVLYHPRVITGAAGVLADTIGVAPALVQTLVWGTILFVPSWILITLLLFARSVFRLFIFPRAQIQRQTPYMHPLHCRSQTMQL
jgi:hypothetical protein